MLSLEGRFQHNASDSAGSPKLEYEPTRLIQVGGGPLLSPLQLRLEETETGQVLVSDELFETYGVGDTQAEAVEEFVEMLLEWHAELASSRKSLTRHLRRQLAMLDYFLDPIR